MRTTRPSARNSNPTQKPTSKRGTIVKHLIGLTDTDVSIPVGITGGVLQNTGPNKLQWRYEGSPDYLNLDSGKETPPGIPFSEGTLLKVKSIGAAGEITTLFW